MGGRKLRFHKPRSSVYCLRHPTCPSQKTPYSSSSPPSLSTFIESIKRQLKTTSKKGAGKIMWAIIQTTVHVFSFNHHHEKLFCLRYLQDIRELIEVLNYDGFNIWLTLCIGIFRFETLNGQTLMWDISVK